MKEWEGTPRYSPLTPGKVVMTLIHQKSESDKGLKLAKSDKTGTSELHHPVRYGTPVEYNFHRIG